MEDEECTAFPGQKQKVLQFQGGQRQAFREQSKSNPKVGRDRATSRGARRYPDGCQVQNKDRRCCSVLPIKEQWGSWQKDIEVLSGWQGSRCFASTFYESLNQTQWPIQCVGEIIFQRIEKDIYAKTQGIIGDGFVADMADTTQD
jgi:hypothetical protein